jgi:hypothetical protein
MRARVARALAVAVAIFFLATSIGAPARAANGRGAQSSATGKVNPLLSELEAFTQVRVPAVTPDRSSGAPDPCSWQPGALYSYLQRNPQPSERINADGAKTTLYARVCGPTDITYYWLPATPTAQQVAAMAMDLARQRIPVPDGVFTPDLRAGRRVIVHARLRFGVRSWTPVTATASVGGVTATVTATPLHLEFDPGDGSAAVSCDSTGQAGCAYSYQNASTVAPNGASWPARLRMTWTVAWTASTGDGGALSDVTTTSTYPLIVGEIQALEQAQ